MQRTRQWLRTWRVALRFARRDARRNKGRSLLVAVMVGLPVLAGATIAVAGRSAQLDPQDVAAVQLGSQAAALVTVGYGGPLVQSPDGEQVLYSGANSDAAQAALLQKLPGELPPGRHVPYVLAGGGLSARVADRQVPIAAAEVDYTDPMLAGWAQQVSGRAPRAPGEVVVNARLARDAGVSIGDGIALHAGGALADGTRLPDRPVTVVGVVRVPSLLGRGAVLGRPGTVLPGGGATSGATPGWFVEGPAVSWSQVRALNALGAVVVSRAVLTSPPSLDDIPGLQQATSQASATVLGILTVAVVLVLLQITLLAGPALAVGARRNQRNLAIMAAAGATPAALRRAVLAAGIVVGLVSSLAFTAVGIVLVQLARGRLEDYSGAPIPRLDLHGMDLLVVVGIGTGTAVAASVVPALQAGRADVVTALAGRRGQAAPKLWVPVTGLVLVIAGLVTAVWAAYSHQPFVVALGLALGEFGLVALSGTLVVLASRLAPRLPLAGRLALRDAARQRGRTAPAVAAVLAVVAGCCAAAVYTAALDAHGEASYTPSGALGDVMVNGTPAQLDQAERAIRALLPVKAVVRLQDFSGEDAVSVDTWDGGPADRRGLLPTTVVLDDGTAVAALTGYDDPRVRAALKEGKAVAFSPLQLADDGRSVLLHVLRDQLTGSSPSTQPDPPPEKLVRLPAVLVRLPLGLSSPALPASALKALGPGVTPESSRLVATTTRMPTAEEEQRLAGQLTDTQGYVERGYRSPYPIFLLVVLVASVVVALGSTLAVVGLAAAEGRADVSTLAAVGAAPRVRRRLAAAQAGVVAVLGTTLGCVSGIVSGVTLVLLSRRELGGGGPDVPADSWEIVVPWQNLSVLVVGLPLLAVVAAALFTRSRLPMVRRLGQ